MERTEWANGMRHSRANAKCTASPQSVKTLADPPDFRDAKVRRDKRSVGEHGVQARCGVSGRVIAESVQIHGDSSQRNGMLRISELEIGLW